MFDQLTLPEDCATAVDRKNGRRIAAWSMAWALAFVASTWLLRSETVTNEPASWMLAVGCLALGAGGLLAFRRFLLEADELVRRIQLEGLAFGFGVGLLIALSYQLFEFVGAPVLDVGEAVTIMIVGYVVGVLLATRRYQ